MRRLVLATALSLLAPAPARTLVAAGDIASAWGAAVVVIRALSQVRAGVVSLEGLEPSTR